MEKRAGRRMRSVTNIFPEPVAFRIAGTPGSAPMLYELEPRRSTDLPPGYVEPKQSAGRRRLTPIIERMTTVTWPDGKRRPAVVPAEEAEERSAAYEAQGAYGTGRKARADKAAEKAADKK